jgi:preprotein translocase subunit SecA
MFSTLLSKIFGTKNERELRSLQPLVEEVGKHKERLSLCSDDELNEHTNKFREQLSQEKSLNAIMPEAFAVVREMGTRKLNQCHFDVQLIGGAVLHSGKISEMKTGEGKTLTATLPLYLNALEGKGAHLVTVNDYLARRDADWMRPIYEGLGLEVGIIQNHMSDDQRKKAYGADITYGTNNEYGFDYLRDNMKSTLEDYAQRDLHYAIVDEVDSILIDEARTPLIISGASEKGSNLYDLANRAVLLLKKDDYEIDEKEKGVHFTEGGTDKVENFLKISNLYAPENILLLHHVTQALKAHTIFKNDVDYVVRDGEVLIVDEFTGRILSGRRYSDGLHQALEAKEGVRIERENQTLASITLQNYFRMYKKLAGMTGTAMTEAGEFHKIYKLDVISIPTNQQMIRDDQADIIFLNREDKFKAVIDDIKDCNHRGQPTLVGTISIETSEYLSYLLNKENIKHNVLNAKQHEREAEIIEEAGELGRVTIATNMAGRGTDIKLGDGVVEAGGLRIIGTERHESRRIDNQLRGRSGRQGDPGSSKFYLSLEDDLMRIFGGERLKKTMTRIGMKAGESIEHRMVTRSIEKAQEKVEKNNFDIRKHLLEYDDVLNQQRTVIYHYRREILEGSEHIKELIHEMIYDLVGRLFKIHCPQKKQLLDQAIHDITESLEKLTGIEKRFFIEVVDATKRDPQPAIIQFLVYQYEQYRAQTSEDLIDRTEKWILLETVDNAWKIHLQNIDHLKEGIGLRGYGQKNPLIEYKRESFHEFERMMEQITWNIVELIFKMKPDNYTPSKLHEIEQRKEAELADIQIGGDNSISANNATVRREHPKIGRNSPCHCKSGKKYKHCCGR